MDGHVEPLMLVGSRSSEYPERVTPATESSRVLRELIGANRADLETVLRQYRASNPRLFGSAARGDATRDSDIDIMVDLDPEHVHSRLLRLSGVAAGFRAVLHRVVDVVDPGMLRENVSETALADAVPM